MRGVGDKTAALLLGIFQPLRQIVEFVAQNGQLVIAAHVYLVSIVSLLDDPHGGHNPVQPPGKGEGEQNGEQNHDGFQQKADPQNRPLHGLNQTALHRVIFGNIHAAHHGTGVVNGGGSPGVHGSVVILPGADVVAFHGGEDLREQNVSSGGLSRTVEQGAAAGVGDDQAGYLQTFHLAYRLGHGGGIEHLQLSNFVGGQQALFHHGGLFAFVKQLLAGLGAIDVQNQQHNKGDDHVGHAVPELGFAVAAVSGCLIFGNNNQRPTSSECILAPPDFLPASPADGGCERPRCGCRCGIHRPRWCPAMPPGNKPGWDCA